MPCVERPKTISEDEVSMSNFRMSVRVLWQASLVVNILVALTGCFPLPKANYPKESLGGQLNPHFAAFVSGCNIVQKAFAEVYKDRDYIPRELWELLPNAKSAKVDLISTASSRLMFLFPFRSDEKNGQTALDPNFIIGNTTRALKEDNRTPLGELDADETLPLKSAGMVLYRQSCASYVNAQAKAEVKFALGRVNSALDTEFQRHRNLLLFYGSFESPLHRVLNSAGSQRRYARLLFLTNFYLNPQVGTEDPWYLREFRGAIMTMADVSERKTDFSIEANAAGTQGVLSGDIDTRATFGEGAKLDGNSFYIFLDKTTHPQTSHNLFEKGPSLDTIK
jgi:hypothetical protein